jgi:hypothetical protein
MVKGGVAVKFFEEYENSSTASASLQLVHPNYPVVKDIINPTKAKKGSTPIISPRAYSSPSGFGNKTYYIREPFFFVYTYQFLL